MDRKELEELSRSISEGENSLREKYKTKLPDGLDLCFLYRDGRIPYVREGVVKEKTDNPRPYDFIGDLDKPSTLPAMPLLLKGEAWHSGWDIPTRWAIDAHKRCWADNAHGHALTMLSERDFLNTIREDDHALRNAHAALGKKPPLPEWMASALSAGWTPSEGFDRSKYE